MAGKAQIRFVMQNFRSVVQSDLEIKPITVLTGANGAGKSSFMYGVMALRNILSNANQPADNFFNLGFVNLGGIKEVVTGKDMTKPVILGWHHCDGATESSYFASIGPASFLRFTINKPLKVDLNLNVSFPYPLVQNVAQDVMWKDRKYRFTFNGITTTVVPLDGIVRSEVGEQPLAIIPKLIALSADFVDVKRGFFRNTYAPLGATSSGEDEVASLLGSDRDLEGRVSVVLQKLINKSFATRHTALGAATFYLQTTDRETGFVCDLVNEGFGVNQLVYLLAKILRKDVSLVCIEEPEIHLHPEALTKLAEQLVSIAKSDRKKFLIASHSEHFVVSLLNLVAKGTATVDDIAIHFVAKDKSNLTKITEQQINEKGQIEGGLKSFYEPSIRALEDFLGPQRDTEHVNPAK
jgi:predicted ATPase